MPCLVIGIAVLAAPVLAMPLETCPSALQFTDRKAEVREALRETRAESTGQFLNRELLAIWATAPDRQAQTLLDRGKALKAALDVVGAQAQFDALVAYCPSYAEGYHQRGVLRLMTRDSAGALTDLDAALALAPDHASAMAGKAVLLLGRGQFDDGTALLRRALELNPWLPERILLTTPPGIAI